MMRRRSGPAPEVIDSAHVLAARRTDSAASDFLSRAGIATVVRGNPAVRAAQLGMRMLIVERDKWYSVIDCRKCDRGVTLGEMLSSEEGARVPAIGSFWKCPHCGFRQIVRDKQVQQCQGIYI
jgi:hypothetical protein